MARLTIEQVKAPDFSASSEMMARANQSFNSGIDSAKGILSKYNEGQQAKGDQALVGALAGLTSEEDLANFLQTTDLSNMNISDTMRANVLGARATILGNNSTRQSTMNAADANSRANAGEGRVAAEYADSVAARDELRALTPAYVGALAEGQTYGRGPNTNQDWLAYDNQGATRNDPLSPELVQSMGFLGDMGVTMRVTSGGQENNTDQGTGSTRHNHGNAADADFYIGDRKLDWNSPQDLPIFQQIVTQARANGVTGIGAGDDYMGAGRMHVGFGNPGVWGANGSGANAPDWLTAAYNGAPAGTAPVTRNGTGGEAAAAFTAALQAGTRMAPDQAAALFNSVLDQQAGGQSLIDAAEARRQTELGAAAQIAAMQDPNNLTPDAVTRDLMSTDGISAANQLAIAGQDRSAFNGVIAPALTPDTQVNAALARTGAADAAAAGNDPLARSFALAETFDTAEGGAGKALMSQFDVPEGSGLDPAYVDRRLQSMADDAGVTKGQMAATLSSVAQGNYKQFVRMLNAASDEEIYANTLSIAERDFGAEAQATLETQRGEQSRREADRASAELQLSTARTRAAKLPAGSDARRAADAEVASLRDTVLKGMTPQEREQNLVDYVSKTSSASLLKSIQSDMARYPKGTPQGDTARADFQKAMYDLVQEVERDDSLTPNEKELLLRDIRG